MSDLVIVPPTPLPAAPDVPQRNDPATFEDLFDAGFEYMFEELRPAMDGLAGNVHNNATAAKEQAETAEQHKSAAGQSAVAAQTAAASAAATVGAQQWEADHPYAVGEAVWSPITFQTYRRTVAGAGAVDPSIDTSSWTALGTSLAQLQANALSF